MALELTSLVISLKCSQSALNFQNLNLLLKKTFTRAMEKLYKLTISTCLGKSGVGILLFVLLVADGPVVRKEPFREYPGGVLQAGEGLPVLAAGHMCGRI